MAGRDEYGGSNVFWYCSRWQQGSVYAGTVMGRNAGPSESLMGDDRKWQLDGSTGGDDDDGHTTASARERTVWRGL